MNSLEGSFISPALTQVQRAIARRATSDKRRRKAEPRRGSPLSMLTLAEINEAVPMALLSRAKSAEAVALSRGIGSTAFDALGRQKGASEAFFGAVEAILADLTFTASKGPLQCCYKSLKSGSFSGQRIGYSTFTAVIDGLAAAGMIEILRGTPAPEIEGISAGRVTRFRATLALLEAFEQHGVELAQWDKHFRRLPRPTSIPNPIRRTASKKPWEDQGKPLPVYLNLPEVAALRAPIDALNAFFAGVDMSPDRHVAFFRLFNHGDQADFAWNKGGRLYSLGGEYQNMSQSERKKIMLNGEPVVEIDIRSSYITILHALHGLPFDASSDPYSIYPYPRDITKAWVGMILGYTKFQRRWAKDTLHRLENYEPGKPDKKCYEDVARNFPIETIKEAVLNRIPLLRHWPTSPYRWADLQFVESSIVIDTMCELCLELGIPVLPVHDSLIVPARFKVLAEATLKKHFRLHTGVVPVVTLK